MLKLNYERIRSVMGVAKIPVTELAGELHLQTIYDIVNENTVSPGVTTVGLLADAMNTALVARGRDPISAFDFLIEYQEG